MVQALLIVASLVAFAAIVAWHNASNSLIASRTIVVRNLLEPAARLLKENESLIKELQAEPFTEPSSVILASYLAKIRRDGVAKNAQMKQRLDQLADNNVAILTLINAYAPSAKTPAFTAEAEKFRRYATSWRDRWNSVMELFMAGGLFAAAEVPFPQGFSAALQTELAAAQ